MIDFRYHLVSIIAIFLALTVGIVLGTTLLQDPLLSTLRSQSSDLRAEKEKLRSKKDAAEKLNAAGDQLVSARSDAILKDRLLGARVVVVESPGVEQATRDGVISAIQQAGGTVSGGLAFTDKYTDTSQSTFIGELANQLAPGNEPPEGAPYDRAGTVLANAVVTPESEKGEEQRNAESEDKTQENADAGTVLAGFAEAGLVQLRGEPAAKDRATVGVVLAPDRPAANENSNGDAGRDNNAMLALSAALDRASQGIVLAGTPSSSRSGALLSQARSEESRFSTVDVAGRPTGDAVVALATASAAQDDKGHYGIGEGADSFLPEPLPKARKSEASPPKRASTTSLGGAPS